MEYSQDDYLMISGIQHFKFCRRQWALIHVEQQWAENEHTVIGELMHKKAHDPYPVSYTHLDVYKRQSQYCVQIYNQLFDTLYGAGIIKEITSDIENFYELVDEEMYTDDKGLNLSVESGMDLYL